MTAAWRSLLRLAVLLMLALLALQIYFGARVALMTVIDPQSTTFQRSEIWRLATEQHEVLWSQDWVAYSLIGDPLKRAVIASEDANFSDHSGVEWDALEKAWERNQRAEARAEKINEQIDKRVARAPASKAAASKPVLHTQPKLVGGSTITQQLAKNLFLGGERSLARKAQEFVITFMLEAMLTKERILEIYLNNVEWGEGIFGAEAAARHYFHVPAARLQAMQAARLAVMLPAPKRFEKRPGSAYVVGRAGTVAARMSGVDLP